MQRGFLHVCARDAGAGWGRRVQQGTCDYLDASGAWVFAGVSARHAHEGAGWGRVGAGVRPQCALPWIHRCGAK